VERCEGGGSASVASGGLSLSLVSGLGFRGARLKIRRGLGMRVVGVGGAGGCGIGRVVLERLGVERK